MSTDVAYSTFSDSTILSPKSQLKSVSKMIDTEDLKFENNEIQVSVNLSDLDNNKNLSEIINKSPRSARRTSLALSPVGKRSLHLSFLSVELCEEWLIADSSEKVISYSFFLYNILFVYSIIFR